MTALKLEYFEYSVLKLIEWSCDSSGKSLDAFQAENDLSKLKVLKLHFFLCAVNSKSNSLLQLFNSFYALPFGHVESELYDAINANQLKRFTFSDGKIIIKDDFMLNLRSSFTSIETQRYKNEIDDSIKTLKIENFGLVNYSAFELVELSHLWTSWKITFKIARSKNHFSEKIPLNTIQSESKFFSLAL